MNNELNKKQEDPGYPDSVVEILDSEMVFPAEVMQAMREFRMLRPWRGDLQTQLSKYAYLNARLAKIYKVQRPLLFLTLSGSSDVRNGFYVQPEDRRHEIHLRNGLSVVTYLHEFGHALGYNEENACRFSVNLFKRIFPKQFAKLDHDKHRIVKSEKKAVNQ